MKAAVFLSILILMVVSDCAIARIVRPRTSQPWLSVLSFPCGDSTENCVGVVLDNQWVLTTATCFRRCKIEIPLQLSAYVNIPPAAQKRLPLSIRLGNKVNGALVWQHPEYNSRTFTNDLALVKLDCHDHTLEKLNLASNCSAQGSQQGSSDGYVYLRNKVINFNHANKEKAECFSRQGTGTFYYHTGTVQMVTTTARGSNCMESLICKDTEQMKSFMQENASECNKMVTLPEQQLINTTSSPAMMPTSTSTSTSTEISEIQTTVVVPTPLSTQSTILKHGSISSDTSTSTKASVLPTQTQISTLSVSTNTLISSHVLKIQSTSEASTSTVLLTAETSSATILPTETSTSTQVSFSTSTLMSSQEVKMQTTSEAPTSTVIPTPASTETSTSTQFSVSTSTPEILKIQTTTDDILLTPTSTETLTSTQTLSSTVTPSSVVSEVLTSKAVTSTSEAVTSTSETVTSTSEVVSSTQLPTATPTESPTSGCQLSIENGVARSRTVSAVFMLITYTCNIGYQFNTLNGARTGPLIYGCVNGKMTIKPPSCERITCPDLDPIGNGTLVISGSGLGSTATYSCDDGYILSDGFTVRVCTEHGEWTGRAGFCERACPIPKALVCSDGQKMLPSHFKYGRLGDTTGYRVRDGYALIGEAPVCQSDFTWSAPPKCRRLCNEKQVVDNAKVQVHRNMTSYTRKIECNEGYKPVGYTDQRCADNGDWTPFFQRCAKTCGQVTIDNGEVRMFESMSFRVAVMQCNEGFHLHPARGASTCINGDWIPSIPRCVETK